MDKIDRLIMQSKMKQSTNYNYDGSQPQQTLTGGNTGFDFHDMEDDLEYEDEYEHVDDDDSESKQKVKQVGKVCDKLIKESAELFRLQKNTDDVQRQSMTLVHGRTPK